MLNVDAVFITLLLSSCRCSVATNNHQVWGSSKQVVRPAFTPLTISFAHKSCTYEACPFPENDSEWIEL